MANQIIKGRFYLNNGDIFEGTVADNFKLVEDYTIMQYGDKLIQFIGGAISVDRSGRKEGTSYWKDEGVEFKKNKCN